MNRSSTLRDLLLVVIGVNSLVFPAIVHLSANVNASLIILGGALLLAGIYSTVRDLFSHS
jgi:hypothetical protein